MQPMGPRRPLNIEARLPTMDDGINAAWSADVGSVTLRDGGRFLILFLVDEFSGECLAIEIEHKLRPLQVIEMLNRIAVRRGYPGKLQIDHGFELVSIALAKWALTHGVELSVIHPSVGIQKGLIERLFRDYDRAMLKKRTFQTLTEAQEHTDSWGRTYNRKLRK